MPYNTTTQDVSLNHITSYAERFGIHGADAVRELERLLRVGGQLYVCILVKLTERGGADTPEVRKEGRPTIARIRPQLVRRFTMTAPLERPWQRK